MSSFRILSTLGAVLAISAGAAFAQAPATAPGPASTPAAQRPATPAAAAQRPAARPQAQRDPKTVGRQNGRLSMAEAQALEQELNDAAMVDDVDIDFRSDAQKAAGEKFHGNDA